VGRAVVAVLLLGALVPQAVQRARQFQPPSRGYLVLQASQAAVGDFARRSTGTGDLVITDQSEVVAWRADRRTVWFPLTEGLLARIPMRPGESHYLLLTTLGLVTRPQPWIRYLQSPGAPPGFEPVAELREASVYARLFLRRPPTTLRDSQPPAPRASPPPTPDRAADTLVHRAR
jgi:hypothetical protein